MEEKNLTNFILIQPVQTDMQLANLSLHESEVNKVAIFSTGNKNVLEVDH